MHTSRVDHASWYAMSNEEIDDLLFEQRISGDIGNLVAILLGSRFALLLLSFDMNYQIKTRQQIKKDVCNDVKKS